MNCKVLLHPVCLESIEFNITPIPDEEDGFNIVEDFYNFNSLPTEQHKKYFYESEEGEYSVIALTSKGDIIFPCTHCLIIDNKARVMLTEGIEHTRLLAIRGFQLWECSEYDYRFFGSESARIVKAVLESGGNINET